MQSQNQIEEEKKAWVNGFYTGMVIGFALAFAASVALKLAGLL